MHPNAKWQETLDLFDALIAEYATCKAQHLAEFGADQVQFCSEVDKRLWQMRWTVDQICDGQPRANAAHSRTFFTVFSDAKAADQLLEEAMHITSVLELLTEAFYFVGWRAVLALRFLPGLKNLNPLAFEMSEIIFLSIQMAPKGSSINFQ